METKGKKVSITDIANELKISKTTVSFILNDKAKEKRISDGLVVKVLNYAAERGYKPNHLAKSLRTGKTMIIALMVEKMSNYFFAQIAYHIEELAYQHGYKIIYCNTDNNLRKTRDLISLFRERQVDGYIITPPAGLEKDVEVLINDGLPVVLFDRYFEDVKASYVVLDNYKASADAVKHLVKNGFKNIALVEVDSNQSQMQDRRTGYLRAIEEAGLCPLIRSIPFLNSEEETIKDLVLFIKKHKEIDAIFFATNYLAFRGIKALNLLELKTPGDIAVIAFDDHEAFDVYSPGITAVAQPVEELARQSILTLLKMLNAKKNASVVQRITVDAELLIRDSTGSVSSP